MPGPFRTGQVANLAIGNESAASPPAPDRYQYLAVLANGLGSRAVRQLAADRGLAVARGIATDGQRASSAVATAAMSARMVAPDLMAFAGVEPDVAVATVHDGIQSRAVSPPPEVARSPFIWRRWLQRFGREA